MNVKILIIALALIILSFVGKGIQVINSVEDTLKESIIQQKSTVEDIGMAFDWYGLTVVDTVVKERYLLISKEEMVTILTEGKEEKNRLLKRYYTNATPEEAEYVAKIKEYDVEVDRFVDKVISIDGRLKGGSEIITEMYDITSPCVDLINEILDLKAEAGERKMSASYEELECLRYFLYLAGTLSLVLVVPFLFSSKDKEA